MKNKMTHFSLSAFLFISIIPSEKNVGEVTGLIYKSKSHCSVKLYGTFAQSISKNFVLVCANRVRSDIFSVF